MRYHKFRIDVLHPSEYRQKFYEILSADERKEDVSYQYGY